MAYTIIFGLPTIFAGGGGANSSTPTVSLFVSQAKIRLQSFTPSKNRVLDLGSDIPTLRCYGREYCRVNLTAEDSIGTYYLWTLPDRSLSTRANLPEIILPPGEHLFTLLVNDGNTFSQ